MEKVINVLFDHQIYDLQNFGGISRMYVDVYDGFNKNLDNNVKCDFSLVGTNNVYLKDKYHKTNGNNSVKSVENLISKNFDIFFPTFYFTYFLNYIENKPFVMSVHDMIPEIYEQYFSRNDIMITGKRKMVESASAIEVPTECTKKDLIRILGVDENKIHVVGRTIKPDFGEKCYDKSIISFPYILYVGQRNAYKRFDWFIKHIVSFMKQHQDIVIVCTGKDFNPYEKKLINDCGLSGRAYTIFADDIAMASLYKYAEFFVFSSEYEGFGLPILEAAKMGCLTLLNDTECFREVTDNKGIFFNLTEKESNLSEVVERVYSMTDKEKKKEIEKQYQLLKKYSFENYINNFKKMFDTVIKQ